MERTNGKRIAIVTGSASDWAMNSRDSSSTADGSRRHRLHAERQTELAGEFPRGSYRGFVGDVSDETSSKPRWPISPRSGTSTC